MGPEPKAHLPAGLAHNQWRVECCFTDLKWGVYVPSNPLQTPLDPRLCQEKDLPRVVFLLDRHVKQTLYWNTERRQWLSYVFRDPGWGLFAGLKDKGNYNDWDREGVFIKNGVRAWRDPITLKLYRCRLRYL